MPPKASIDPSEQQPNLAQSQACRVTKKMNDLISILFIFMTPFLALSKDETPLFEAPPSHLSYDSYYNLALTALPQNSSISKLYLRAAEISYLQTPYSFLSTSDWDRIETFRNRLNLSPIDFSLWNFFWIYRWELSFIFLAFLIFGISKKLTKIQTTIIVLFVISGIFCFWKSPPRYGINLCPSISVKENPSPLAEDVEKLEISDTVTITDQRGDWYSLSKGWVQTSCILKI